MADNDEFDEAAAIGNFWTDTIYTFPFTNGAGKFFHVVTEEEGNTSISYHPPYPSRNRIKLTVRFIQKYGEIDKVTIKKFKQYKTGGVPRWEEQSWGEPMEFTHFSFQKLLAFLKLLTELDLANLNERRIALREGDGEQIDNETQVKMRALLNRPEGMAIIDELLRNGSITSRDLVNVGYRKNQLEVFRKLLCDPAQITSYRAEHGIKEIQPEKVWQHFFRHNEWIFGFGLDYRFLSILQTEAHVSGEDLAGRDGAITDFLMAAANFTVLVEIKRPDTPLFERGKNRAGSWKLSNELVDAVSQILEQKAEWQVKAESAASDAFDAGGRLIRQRTIDPKAILIVGSDSQFSGTEKETDIKLRTFELFRRDSRNVEIVTYDELFQRAEFIVDQSSERSF